MTRLVNNEAPSLTIDNSMDLRLPNAKSRTKIGLRPSTARVHLTNLTDVISRQLLGIDTTLGGSVFEVVLRAPNKEMGRVNTTADITAMENAQALRDCADEQFISQTVSRERLLPDADSAIARLRIDRSDPNPTFVSGGLTPHIRHEPILDSFGLESLRSSLRIVTTTADGAVWRLWFAAGFAVIRRGYTHEVSLLTRLTVPRLFVAARGFSVPRIIPFVAGF